MINDKYCMKDSVGEGAYNLVHVVTDNKNKNYALKIPFNRKINKEFEREVEILTTISMSNFIGLLHFPELIDIGYDGECPFIIMELLGQNLHRLQNSVPNKRFQPKYIYNVVRQIVSALQCLHSLGIVHSDVKPSNICISYTNINHFYLIDFGLTKKINESLKGKSYIPGTVRYASIPMHKRLPIAPADDLLSLFYSAIELAEKELPWRRLVCASHIYSMKIRFHYHHYVECLSNPFYEFFEYLMNVSDRTVIRYDYLIKIVYDCYKKV